MQTSLKAQQGENDEKRESLLGNTTRQQQTVEFSPLEVRPVCSREAMSYDHGALKDGHGPAVEGAINKTTAVHAECSASHLLHKRSAACPLQIFSVADVLASLF